MLSSSLNKLPPPFIVQIEPWTAQTTDTSTFRSFSFWVFSIVLGHRISPIDFGTLTCSKGSFSHISSPNIRKNPHFPTIRLLQVLGKEVFVRLPRTNNSFTFFSPVSTPNSTPVLSNSELIQIYLFISPLLISLSSLLLISCSFGLGTLYCFSDRGILSFSVLTIRFRPRWKISVLVPSFRSSLASTRTPNLQLLKE